MGPFNLDRARKQARPQRIAAPRPRGGSATRREFLQTGGLAALAAVAGQNVAEGACALNPRFPRAPRDGAVIYVGLIGGPSQLETWDPKPDAPAEFRGPFGSIATSVPGVRISEHLPKLASRMRKLTLIRSLHHNEVPIHETGLQLLQTGGLIRNGQERPHWGALAASRWSGAGAGQRGVGFSPFVILPKPLGNTGVAMPQGQSPGSLGAAHPALIADPEARSATGLRIRLSDEPRRVRESYGETALGRSCLRARQYVEAGAKAVVINAAETVFDRESWDCHGSRPFSSLDDYRRSLLPGLDHALSALIDDLERRGRLDSTLIVAAGEFGRAPRLNSVGGRDHWTHCWSALLAGGGSPSGTVIGASDSRAAEPIDEPIHASELARRIARFLDVESDLDFDLDSAPDIRSADPKAAQAIRA